MFRIGEVFGAELSLAAFYEAPTLAACAAAIDAARPVAAPAAIGRRDRSAYRVAASRTEPVPAPLHRGTVNKKPAGQEQEG